MKPSLVPWIFVFLLPVPLLAQSAFAERDDQLPPLLERAHEISLARSAAPAHVSAAATVYVLERGGYVEAVAGSNGVVCYVSRSWSEAIEPHCFDEEGARTIFPMDLLRAELKEEGLASAAIDAELARGLLEGRFQLPVRPAMSYMMSSAQILYDDEGRRVGAWNPHIMIYIPYITSEDIGAGAESLVGPVVVDPGTPRANVMVIVPDWVDPIEGTSPAPAGGR